MGQANVGGAGLDAFFDPQTVLIARRSRVDTLHHLAHHARDEVLADLGAVVEPVGTHHAERRILLGQQDALLAPEGDESRPDGLGRGPDFEPALVAASLELDVLDLGQHITRRGDPLALFAAAGIFGEGRRLFDTAWNIERVIEAAGGQVRWNLKILGRLALFFVDETLIGQVVLDLAHTTTRQRQQRHEENERQDALETWSHSQEPLNLEIIRSDSGHHSSPAWTMA